MNRSRGRPIGGGPSRRERILSEARTAFLDRGYHGATMRAIATASDVDVALVSYYFGSKRDLFAAALALELRPARVVRGVAGHDPARIADRLLRAVLLTWENPALSSSMRTFIESAMTDPELLRSFREYIEHEVVDALADHLPDDRARTRAHAAVQVVIGLIFSRYILRLEPFARVPPREAYRILRPVMAAAVA
ncbi:TetR family transcriptional regulator [Agromyces sp. SYSU T00266]|uniref:TetR/AcrR family transcriptional regulator n=1 Tax=Agromyces zhanjiangensis TaxID=3158562 RepID=UPI00339470D4